ncbi:hypothetical protein RUM8411_02735 [Ruegeria meonggei]|uniref:Uncharacterized protein n=1 Tax=Ruegeria meonggei TaxID=1446476 RepID=A0A1X6ZNA2_9RHOB|nr:hypothetical protein RUM8411_02735 [Ruegeria meonggei]
MPHMQILETGAMAAVGSFDLLGQSTIDGGNGLMIADPQSFCELTNLAISLVAQRKSRAINIKWMPILQKISTALWLCPKKTLTFCSVL